MAKKEVWEKIEKWTEEYLELDEGVRIEMIQNAISCANTLGKQATLALIYIYGMRPAELVSLRKSNFTIKEGQLTVGLPTAKRGHKRTITLDIADTPFLHIIISYVNSLSPANARLFPRWNSPTNINRAIYKIENKYEKEFRKRIYLAPYVFRKFRLSYLGMRGADIQDLLAWKGGKSIKPLESYLALRPVTKWAKAIR